MKNIWTGTLLLIMAVALIASPFSVKNLVISNDDIAQEFYELSESIMDVSEYGIELSCELSSSANSVNLNLVNSYDSMVDTLKITISGNDCLNLLSSADTTITGIASGSTSALSWDIELLCDTLPSCFEIYLNSVILDYIEDTLTGTIDTTVTRDSTRIFGCATDADCSTFGITAIVEEPMDGQITSFANQNIYFQIYDEVGDNIIDNSIVVVINHIDTFRVGEGYNLLFSEADSLLIFTPLGWREWTNNETVTVELISAENDRGFGLVTPIEFSFAIDLEEPIVWNMTPEPGGFFHSPFPVIEFDIMDSLSGIDESSILIRFGSRVYTLGSPNVTKVGEHVTLTSIEPIDEGENIRVQIEASDMPDLFSPNDLSFRYDIRGEDFAPWAFPIEPEDGDIVACEDQDIQILLKDSDGIIESSVEFFIVRTDTTELTLASPGVSYSYSDGEGIITYTPSTPWENAEEVTVCVSSMIDSSTTTMELSPICWSFTMDTESPIVWDFYPADEEIITTSRPEISWKMWDPGFGMEHVDFDINIFGMDFDMDHPAFHYYPEESLVVFNSEESGIDFIGGDTVALVLNFTDDVTLCSDHSGTISWYFVIEGGGPLVSILRPVPSTISSCDAEYFAFSLIDSTGIDTNTIAIEINGTEIEWADGGFIYEPEEEMLYYIPDSLTDQHYNIEFLRANDLVGNHLLFPVGASFLYDTHPPEIFDVYPSAGSEAFEHQPVISFKYNDLVSGTNTAESIFLLNGVEYPLWTTPAISITDTMISFDTEIAGFSFDGGEIVRVGLLLYDFADGNEGIGDWDGTDCPANVLDTTWEFTVTTAGPYIGEYLPNDGAYSACNPLQIEFLAIDSLFDIEPTTLSVRVHRPDHVPVLDDTFTIADAELVEDVETENNFILTHPTDYISGETVEVEILSIGNSFGNPSTDLPISWTFYTDFDAPVADTFYPPFFYVTDDTMSICFNVGDELSGIDFGHSYLTIDTDSFGLDDPAVSVVDPIVCFDPVLGGMSWSDSSEYDIRIMVRDYPDFCDPNEAEYSWTLHSNFSAIQESIELPADYILSQNRPNPFNPYTDISFTLLHSGNISLKIYDIEGNEIQELAAGHHEKGQYTVRFDGKDYPSGIYFYVLNHTEGTEMQKMMLIK